VSKTSGAAVGGVADMLARKEKEPLLINKAQPRRPKKKAPIKKARPAPPPQADDDEDEDVGYLPLTVYTSFKILRTQRQSLRDEASARARRDITTRTDVSLVLRDWLDYVEAHRKEVDAWLKARRRAAVK
jgi:hypothetical protein